MQLHRRLISAALACSALFALPALADSPIKVEDPYVRLVPTGTPNTGAFMVIKNVSNADRKVVKAALCTNMFPGDGPDWTMRMDKTSNMQLQQITIPFTAITQHGTGVRRVAQSVLDGISVRGANPYHRAAFINEIAPDVMAAASGYNHQVEQIRQDAVRLG